MKKILIILLLGMVIPLNATPVQAHVLKTDGNIGVVFHVDPDDDPIPGQTANLYFLIDDKTKKFDLAKCQCTVSLIEQGKPISSQPLTANNETKPSIWGASMSYIFPSRDVYQIILKGTPIEPNTFQAFNLSWEFRVDKYPINQASQATQSYLQQHDPTFIYFVAAFLGVPLLLGIVLFLALRH